MTNASVEYVHGYAEHELQRLRDQSDTLSDLLHHDTRYPAGSRVLEAGCGVGAQTINLLKNSPEADITSLDISMESIHRARDAVSGGDSLIPFLQANIFGLPFAPDTFDHIFVCFVLEHLPNPEEALQRLKTILKPGGTLTVIEGDHGSCYFYPDSENARHVWNCLVDAQAQLGGDSLIGRRLYPLLHHAGFQQINVTPRVVYADHSRPQWVEGFTIKTICAMVEGVHQRALEMKLTDEKRWDAGMKALRKTAEAPDGVFNYSFFKGIAVKER